MWFQIYSFGRGAIVYDRDKTLNVFNNSVMCAFLLQITLGRATKDNPIDVDLSLEGPAWKISRRQGVIKLRNNGDFFVANEGRRPIYIDGKPVLNGNKQKLNNNSVVEVRNTDFFIEAKILNII